VGCEQGYRGALENTFYRARWVFHELTRSVEARVEEEEQLESVLYGEDWKALVGDEVDGGRWKLAGTSRFGALMEARSGRIEFESKKCH